jgi:hypothetical protein
VQAAVTELPPMAEIKTSANAIKLIFLEFGFIVYLSLPDPRLLTWDNLEGLEGLIRPRLLTGVAG